MTEINRDIPEPDEQFLDAFEQRLREGIRRRALLDTPGHAPGSSRRKGLKMIATASLMLLSMMLGATGTYAVVHQEAAPYRELHVQKASILLDRAKVRLDRRQAELDEIEPRIEQGLINPIEAGMYRQAYARAVAEVHRRELDLEEVRLTGRAPVDDLTAPPIEGEDFVMRRLQVRLEPVDFEVHRRGAELERIETLFQDGRVSERELIVHRTRVVEAEQKLVRLQRRITLRREFIAGEIAPEVAELQAMLRDAEADHEVAAARVKTAKMKLHRMSALHEHGAVTTGEVREVETEVREAESDLALAEVELTLLRQRLDALKQED